MTLLTHLYLECPASFFLLNSSIKLSETQFKKMALALSFSLILAQRAPLSTVTHSHTEIEKNQPSVVIPLEKSPLAAKGHTVPMNGKVVIQSAFHEVYNCVFELMVFFSVSREARRNILGKDFSAEIGEFFNLRNRMIILTVFLGKCVKRSFF